MPPLHDEAICLRHSEWSETSQLVTLLCRQHGLVRGLARGSRRERGSFSGGFELLTSGTLVFYEKPTRELANLTAWDLTHTHAHLRRDLQSLYRALFAADLTQHALPIRQPHPRTFENLAALLGRSGLTMADLAWYQWALLVDTGHQPDLSLPGEPADAPVGQADGVRPGQPREGPDGPTGATPAGSQAGRPAVHGPVVYFLPQSGRVALAAPTDGQQAWPMRASTLRSLRGIPSVGWPDSPGDRPRTGAEDAIWRRASAFLCTYWTWVLGRPIPASQAVFGQRIGPAE